MVPVMAKTPKIQSLGVDWFLPGAKRRFASSTRATSYLIEALGDEGHTVSSAHDELRYDPEGRAILARYVEAGYGLAILADVLANKV